MKHMTENFDDISVRDRLMIADRLARYSWALDSADMPAYLDCFTSDGVLRHPLRDGGAGVFSGHEGITRFISENFRQRDLQAYGHQHQFNALRLTRKSAQIQVDAYCMIYRHEFHRRYWPSGPSWRMGTWHALCRYVDDGWRIADLDIRMWTDTAFGTTGTRLAPQRQPGMPGTRE